MEERRLLLNAHSDEIATTLGFGKGKTSQDIRTVKELIQSAEIFRGIRMHVNSLPIRYESTDNIGYKFFIITKYKIKVGRFGQKFVDTDKSECYYMTIAKLKHS